MRDGHCGGGWWGKFWSTAGRRALAVFACGTPGGADDTARRGGAMNSTQDSTTEETSEFSRYLDRISEAGGPAVEPLGAV